MINDYCGLSRRLGRSVISLGRRVSALREGPAQAVPAQANESATNKICAPSYASHVSTQSGPPAAAASGPGPFAQQQWRVEIWFSQKP